MNGRFTDCVDGVEGNGADEEDTPLFDPSRAFDETVARERFDYQNVPWKTDEAVIDRIHCHVCRHADFEDMQVVLFHS